MLRGFCAMNSQEEVEKKTRKGQKTVFRKQRRRKKLDTHAHQHEFDIDLNGLACLIFSDALR